jgi:hypothetical protein
MMGMSAESAEGAQRGLERGIAELKAKYEALEEAAERKKEAEAASARAAFRASAAGKAAEEAARVDMRMDDPEVEALRQARMAALKASAAARKQGLQEGRGELREIAEDEFLKEVTSARFVAVHFFHDEFMTCKVMDKHLRALAPRCVGVKFVRINANKAAFFVAKIKVKVLPTLAFFVDGVLIGRQTGFEGLVKSAADQDFPTLRLLNVLRVAGMLGDAEKKAAVEEDGDEDEDDGGAAAGGGGGGGAGGVRLRRQAEDDEEDNIGPL